MNNKCSEFQEKAFDHAHTPTLKPYDNTWPCLTCTTLIMLFLSHHNSMAKLVRASWSRYDQALDSVAGCSVLSSCACYHSQPQRHLNELASYQAENTRKIKPNGKKSFLHAKLLTNFPLCYVVRKWASVEEGHLAWFGLIPAIAKSKPSQTVAYKTTTTLVQWGDFYWAAVFTHLSIWENLTSFEMDMEIFGNMRLY